MIAREDAYILLEGLNYFTNNPSSKIWGGYKRGEFLGSLSDIFLTDNLDQIRKDLEIISAGKIESTTIPLDVRDRANNLGITKENLEVRVQDQRSQVNYWVNKIKREIAREKTQEIVDKGIKDAKSSIQEKETVQKEQRVKIQTPQKSSETVLPKEKVSTTTTKEQTFIPIEEETTVIPVTGKANIVKEVVLGQKLENIQIKFDVNQKGNVEEILASTQPFYAASIKTAQSDFIDLSPSLNLISKGISSEQIEKAASSLPDSTEKQSLFRVSYTMNEIERIFPNEIKRFRTNILVENVEINVSPTDFTPARNNVLLKPNEYYPDGYSAFDGDTDTSFIADIAKDKILNKTSDKIVSTIKNKIGSKLTKSAFGKAMSSLAAKFSSSAIGKAISMAATKIGAFLGTLIPIPIIGQIIGAIAGAVASWISDKILPIIRKVKEGIKNTSKAVLATAATIIMIPFLIFFSAAALPFLIVIITLPISVALFMFIINSGAFVVPPKTIPNSDLVSPYIDIIKTADPSGPFENSDIPIEIEYTVEIKAKKSALSNIRIKDDCTVIKRGTPPTCPTTNPSIPSGIEIPDTISPNTPFSFTYKRSFTSNNFKDTLTIDTVTITANVPEQQNAEAAASASVRIGDPPDECPNNAWPIAGNGGLRYVTQGPFCSRYSHANMRAEAIDIGGVNGSSVVAVHSGIAKVAVDDCYGKYIDIKSSCGSSVFISRYAHLGAVTINNGQMVTFGQTIGIADNTGSCTSGPHLHFDFRSESAGRVNPPTMGKPYLIRDIPNGCCTVAECN